MKQSIVYELERGNLLALNGLRGRELRVESGQIWLTEQAQPSDNVLGSNQSYVARSDQHVVIEALAPTRLMLPQDDAAGDLHAGLQAAWSGVHQVAAALYTHIARLHLGRVAQQG
jgi:hypothetical protein